MALSCGGGGSDSIPAASACPAGAQGLDCLFQLWDRVRQDCEPAVASAFVESIDRRHGDLPAWHRGRALFVSRRYPVLFLHDGQNVFDDHRCCAVPTGWEINRTLDREIEAGAIDPIVAVGFDFAAARGDEYGGAKREAFLAFQVEHVQARAAELWRLDANRVYVAGSSFGGNAALLLAFTYPDVYAGAASLSGNFQQMYGTPESIFAVVARTGKIPVALYVDHGDGAGDRPWLSLEMRDLLVSLGFPRIGGPDCRPGPGDLCYFYEPGAEHDEVAWGRRAPLFLRAFFSAHGVALSDADREAAMSKAARLLSSDADRSSGGRLVVT